MVSNFVHLRSHRVKSNMLNFGKFFFMIADLIGTFKKSSHKLYDLKSIFEKTYILHQRTIWRKAWKLVLNQRGFSIRMFHEKQIPKLKSALQTQNIHFTTLYVDWQICFFFSKIGDFLCFWKRFLGQRIFNR